MTINEYYGHGLSQEIGENHRTISYSKDLGKMEGFIYDPINKKYTKDVLLRDINNAFFITTKAYYKGQIFKLEPYYGNDIHYHLTTMNKSLGMKLGFYELHNGHGQPYYLSEVKKVDVYKLWEERTQSSYKLPMPKGIEFIKELKT